MPAGRPHKYDYPPEEGKGRRWSHRIWYHYHRFWPPLGYVVDHIDGNNRNNARENLRLADWHTNGYNRIGWSRSGEKGVSWVTRDRKWRVSPLSCKQAGNRKTTMKTTIKEITPQWAKKVLELHNPQNRKLSDSFVSRLERDIRAGAFITTHQGIAFDANGDLIDGQHRLAAIANSGCTVKMMVTSGLQTEHLQNGYRYKTFEALDNGKPRSTGAMIAMNGWPNGNKVAAVARALMNWMAGNETWLPVTTFQTERLLSKCGDDIEWSVRATTPSIIPANAGIRAALVVFHSFSPAMAEKFADSFSSLENVKRKHPAYVLGTWLRHHPRCNTTNLPCRVASSAIYHFVSGNELEKIYANDEAARWLIHQNEALEKYIVSILKPSEMTA